MRTFFTFCLIAAAVYMNAQSVVSTLPMERNAVLEEYTGITCGYCPDGHYRANLLASENPGRVVLINIHQGSFAVPTGIRPDFRTQWGDALATNAGITGYPSGTVNRQIFSELGSTYSLARNQWSYAASKVFPEQSPVNIGFWSEIDTVTRDLTVTVELYYTKSSAQATNYINVALLQNNVLGWQTDYASPAFPGGNTNNYNHKHILRHLVTGQWGDAVTTTTSGTLVTRTYTYNIPDSLNNTAILLDDCQLAVFVSESHNNIYTGFESNLGDTISGETVVYTGALTGTSPQAQQGAQGVEGTDHLFQATSALAATEQFRFVLETNAPNDWAYKYSANGTDYTDTAFIDIAAGGSLDLNLSVTPGALPKFAKFTLTMTSTTYPSSSPKVFEYYVMSGITDLIVNGSGAFGDGNTYDYTQKYIDGLNFAGNTHFDAIPAAIMTKASDEGILGTVNNLYLNIGWTFPSFTDEEATALMNFMDNGGNVLVAGQDIGWDIMSGSGYGTVTTKDLFQNYFHAIYSADGSSTNNQFIPTNDTIFEVCGKSPIVDAYNGNIYPDEINPGTGAVVIFNYNTTGTKKGGIRFSNGTFKIVYLCVGIEMLSNTDTANAIIKRTHDWFNGLIQDAEMTFINETIIYPNPANDYLTIKFDGKIADEITITDLCGRVIKVFSNSSSVRTLDISELSSGTYVITMQKGYSHESSIFQVNR